MIYVSYLHLHRYVAAITQNKRDIIPAGNLLHLIRG